MHSLELLVLSLTANLMACFHLCRHATENKFYRLLASLLSAFSLTLLARISHAQLMPAFAGVLAIDSFIDATDIRKLSTKGIDKKSSLLYEKEIVISISGIHKWIYMAFAPNCYGFLPRSIFHSCQWLFYCGIDFK